MRWLRELREFFLALPPPISNGSSSSVRAPDSGESEILERWADTRPMHYVRGGDDLLRAATSGPRKTEQRSRICNMRWSNATVLLGDTDFIRCRFFACTLIADGPFSMERCYLDGCIIESKEPS
jgi:hypothetical protein